MKVLVTGATSGLGRNAVEYLRNRGISVRATGRNEAMGKLLSKMGAEFVPADLTELVSSQAKVMLAGIDTLWHSAGFRFSQRPRNPSPRRMGGCLGRTQLCTYLLAVALFCLPPSSRCSGRFSSAAFRQRIRPQQGGKRRRDPSSGASQPEYPLHDPASAKPVWPA